MYRGPSTGDWKTVSAPKLKGAFGITDYKTKTIKINKPLHKKAKKDKKNSYGVPKKDMTIINTEVHELMHKDHPKMHEKTVRKNTRKKVAKMSTKAKAKIYSKFK